VAEVIRANRQRFTDGVVHSYTGSVELMEQYLSLDLYIGAWSWRLRGARHGSNDALSRTHASPTRHRCRSEWMLAQDARERRGGREDTAESPDARDRCAVVRHAADARGILARSYAMAHQAQGALCHGLVRQGQERAVPHSVRRLECRVDRRISSLTFLCVCIAKCSRLSVRFSSNRSRSWRNTRTRTRVAFSFRTACRTRASEWRLSINQSIRQDEDDGPTSDLLYSKAVSAMGRNQQELWMNRRLGGDRHTDRQRERHRANGERRRRHREQQHEQQQQQMTRAIRQHHPPITIHPY